MLAKAAASLDLLTQGHVELGLRAGAFWEPIAAMGGPHRSTRKSVSVLSEACASARPSAIASTNWAYVTPGAARCAVPSPGRP
jgi:alkanesulfonate monooxygenase SsuD/methylene tetrahydromethanopterin reductase-like flavin-dependent oxidoreductase (luciferase family)